MRKAGLLKTVRLFALLTAVLFLYSSCQSQTPEQTTVSETAVSSGSVLAEQSFSESDDALYNPLMGFAAEADYTDAVGDNTLVYIDILWREIEPEEGVYDFSQVDEDNQIARWKSEGKHAVLRFICDKPSDEEHMDIPDWLYEQTGDGTHYAYDDTHKGYSPNYANETLIAAHAEVIAALGEHYGADSFVSYVELGSLGHWGEWHVNYEAGIVRMPKEEVREQYVIPYLTAFPDAKILMRRPFNTAAEHGFGLYDDSAGNPEATEDWLQWIAEGGDYAQAEEENALTAMPEQWQIAPIGGEFNSSLTYDEMFGDGLTQTLSLLQRSHTTFLGPKFPHALDEENGKGYEAEIAQVLKTMGYRQYIKQASMSEYADGSTALTLLWENTGVAPMYWDWTVCLYYVDAEGAVLSRIPTSIRTTMILPGEEYTYTIPLRGNTPAGAARLCIGIEDPMTNSPAVTFASETEHIDHMAVLFELA